MLAGGGCPKVGAVHSQISHQASQTLMGSLSPLHKKYANLPMYRHAQVIKVI